MKRWAVLTAGLYGLLVVLIVWPLLGVAFPLETLGNIADAADWLGGARSSAHYWLAALATLALIQFLYLLVPLRVAQERPVGRRHWVSLAAASGVLFGILVFGAVCVLVEDLFREPFPEGGRMNGAVAAGAVSWLIWGIVFYRLGTRSDTPVRAVATASNALLGGSMLEMLVAIPSHVLARHRDYCCAGFGTFVGLATGLATMLFAYGPGVLFLFAERWAWLTRQPNPFPVPPRLTRHAGDALAWLVFGGVFLVLCSVPLAVSGVLGRPVLGVERWHFGLGLIGFSVMCAVSIVHAVLAWFRREPRRRVTLVIAILALEFLAWMVWMWPVASGVVEQQ